MSRSERLLDLLQILRRHRRPVSGRALAEETGVSLRTLYRDIASLQAQGAPIEGEAGLGYVLKPGFVLPPMMFSSEEIEALVLGMRWVAHRADAALAGAAGEALVKVAAVLPPALAAELEAATLLVGPRRTENDAVDVATLRRAIRSERKLRLSYVDAAGAASERIIWPFALGFFDEVRVVAGWCEMRQDLRHFRVDRMQAMEMLSARYPARRQALMAQWRLCHGPADGN
ncbi:helix-turn-helix transcriptional regulator [Ensifer soli]|uniref:helix-turn-helix transcriptional regulator n=1 Tax=Ciceribacter sp. sgz301302 TaxID=3342379 RepID=UPI0035BA8381